MSDSYKRLPSQSSFDDPQPRKSSTKKQQIKLSDSNDLYNKLLDSMNESSNYNSMDGNY